MQDIDWNAFGIKGGEQFGSSAFDPSHYVLKCANNVRSTNEVRDFQRQTQRACDETAKSLKASVVENYRGFIETSKEISNLEQDMVKLRALMGDMSSTAKAVGELSSLTFDDQDEANRIKKHQRVMQVMNSVEGCSDLAHSRGREIVFECDVTEVDGNSYSHVRNLHLFLFNDILLVTMPTTRRRNVYAQGGGKKYTFLYQWDIQSLVIVDINKQNRRPDELQNSFKLMHPMVLTYQCSDLVEKSEILKQIQLQQLKIVEINIAKDLRLKRETEEREARKRQKEEEARVNAELGYFGRDEVSLPADKFWLMDVPDDLDVYIAQRQFEDAVELVVRTREEIQKPHLRNTKLCQELNEGLDLRVSELTNILTVEMENNALRHLNSQHYVGLCVKLGQIRKARTMFLKRRGIALRRDLKNVKVESGADAYIEKLSYLFFVNLQSFTTEFLANFVRKPCRIAYIVWITNEIRYFVSIFSRHVFDGMPLSMVAKCVASAKKNSALLEDVGLDIYYVISSSIQSNIAAAMKSTAANILLSSNGALNTPSSSTVSYTHELDPRSFSLHPSTALFCQGIDNYIKASIELLDGCPGNASFVLEQLDEIYLKHSQRLQEHSLKNNDKNMDFAIDKDYLVNIFIPVCAMCMENHVPDCKRALVKIQKDAAAFMV